MIEKLIEVLHGAWESLSPFAIVQAYEQGAIMRLGAFNRCIDAGKLHWKWPVIESFLNVTTAITTHRLAPQTLTTKDGVSVVVAAIVKYQIRDLQPYVTQIWDQQDVLVDVSMGAVRIAVADINYNELVTSPPEGRVLELVRKEVNQFGFKVHKVTFTDLGRVRSYRFIADHPAHI